MKKKGISVLLAFLLVFTYLLPANTVMAESIKGAQVAKEKVSKVDLASVAAPILEKTTGKENKTSVKQAYVGLAKEKVDDAVTVEDQVYQYLENDEWISVAEGSVVPKGKEAYRALITLKTMNDYEFDFGWISTPIEGARVEDIHKVDGDETTYVLRLNFDKNSLQVAKENPQDPSVVNPTDPTEPKDPNIVNPTEEKNKPNTGKANPSNGKKTSPSTGDGNGTLGLFSLLFLLSGGTYIAVKKVGKEME